MSRRFPSPRATGSTCSRPRAPILARSSCCTPIPPPAWSRSSTTATGPADAEITDEYGVLHRVWRVNDPAVIRLLVTAMADKKLIIADGHHRYETALAYSKEHALRPCAAGPNPTCANLPHPPYPEAAVMMTFVNMDSEGLVILPTHRVVHSLAGLRSRRRSPRRPKQFFTIRDLAGIRCRLLIENLKQQTGTAFIAVTRSGAYLFRAKPDAVARRPGNLAGTPAPTRPECPAHHRARSAARPGRRKDPRADQSSAIFATPAKPSSRCGAARPTWCSSPIRSPWSN